MLLVLVSVSELFLPSMRLDNIYLGLADWQPFGKELIICLTICSLCIMFFFVILVVSLLWFRGRGSWIFAPGPVHALSFIF